MKYYIAGPITGHADTYRKEFFDAEHELLIQGHIALNPALMPDGLEYEAYMRIGLAMLEECDGIYLLEGWETSEGAKRELREAMRAGKTIMCQRKSFAS